MWSTSFVAESVIPYAYIHACMLACLHVCINTGMYACMHACMYVCMHVHVCMHVCMYVGETRASSPLFPSTASSLSIKIAT